MKFSSTEEYGLRCMLQMAKKGIEGNTTIVELAQKEALTTAYVAKIMSILRKAGLVQSIRGQSGGYQLSKSPQEINVHEVMEAMSGKFFKHEDYCDTPSVPASDHLGCIHNMDCAIRSLWMGLDMSVSSYLRKCKLSDLVQTEPQMMQYLQEKTENPPRRREDAKNGISVDLKNELKIKTANQVQGQPALNQ
jgi:Rrf2 family protein